MVAGSMNNLNIELRVAKPPRLLVVGEAVSDRYLWGTVERVSPEAPIPVLHLTCSEERLGNAPFVAASVRALGGEAHLLSVVGADVDGRKLGRIATDLGIGCDSLFEVSGRSTIVKERLLGAAQSAQRVIQQMLRVTGRPNTIGPNYRGGASGPASRGTRRRRWGIGMRYRQRRADP